MDRKIPISHIGLIGSIGFMINWLYKKTEEFLKDAVYAANDGIITTFAVVAGVVGASLEPIVILALGFANLLADGISMASGNYLGTKSEGELYQRERNRHRRAIRENRTKYEKHLEKFLEKRGYPIEQNIARLAKLIADDENLALDFTLHDELGMAEQEPARALKGGVVTFISFSMAGLVPLVPYIFFSGFHNAFLYASISTGAALFVVGAVRSVYMEKSWFFAGLEMFIVGGIAAIAAYGIGFLVSQII